MRNFGFLLIFFLSMFFSSGNIFAADHTVTSPSQVPPGFSKNGGYYTSASSWDRYIISSSSAAQSTVDTSNTDSILGDIYSTNARSGDFSYTDIPNIIVALIENLLLLTGTICVIALVYNAVRMQIASGITGDSSHVDHAKDGIKWSLIWFVLSMSAWFLMTKFVEILSNIS